MLYQWNVIRCLHKNWCLRLPDLFGARYSWKMENLFRQSWMQDILLWRGISVYSRCQVNNINSLQFLILKLHNVEALWDENWQSNIGPQLLATRVSDIISNVAEVQQSKPLPTLPIMGVPERSLYYTCRKAVMERHSIYKYA